jgi:multidrug efflux pump subunit AcrA (membrane-fusion protein)
MSVALLQLQSEMRRAKSLPELGYMIANETRVLLRAQQIVVLASGFGRDLVVHHVSSLSTVDRSTPLVLWFESLPKALKARGHFDRVTDFDASAFSGDFADVEQAYPLRHMQWAPWLSHDASVVGGLLLARSTPWTARDLEVSAYLAEAFAHAWSALANPRRQSLAARMLTRRASLAATAIAAAALALPVPMTALAPVEIGPRETMVVTPGIEGVVRSVEVEPNTEVKAGQLLLTLNDISLRNRAEIAEREVLVAESKHKKAAQLAFVDTRGRHEMAIAGAELDLKLAERDFARELLKRTEIRAERDGVAFYADKKDLVGKPVAVGEKLMEIADPASSEFRIDLPAADAVVLVPNARVKVFLDSDPLNPIEARLVRASYKAAPREAQLFAFRLVATASASDAPRLRLGMRGTAQVYSDNSPLGFYLFRRPIAAARQWTGL